MENTHIVHAFDKDLKKIETLLLQMGHLAQSQIVDSMTALVDRNLELGKTVRQTDDKMDALEIKINEKAVRLIALRQPMAEDLRMIVAIMKVSASLERIGDYAKNIAKRLNVLVETPAIGSSNNTLKQMSHLVQEMIMDVMKSFIDRDMELAADVRQRDKDVDELNNTMFRELLTHMMEDPRSITACMHLLFIAKNIERAGDHTTSIAEQVHYLINGSLPTDDRDRGDMTSMMR